MTKLMKFFTGGCLSLAVLVLAGSAHAFPLELSSRLLDKPLPTKNNILPQVLGQKLLAQMTVDQNGQQPMMDQQQPTQPYPPKMDNQNNPPKSTCMVNGKEMPGDCSQYNNGQPNQGNQPNQPMPNDQNNQPGGNQNQNPNPDQSARQLNDIQGNAQRMLNQVKRVEKNFASSEKKGLVASADMKAQLAKIKEELNKAMTATSPESLQDFDFGMLNQELAELEQSFNELNQQAQQFKNAQDEGKKVAKYIKMFETRIAKFEKQKIIIPVEIKETVASVKKIITAINTAKTWKEVESVGIEDIQDLMNSLQESQELLNMLSRWPQTLKEVNSQLKKFNLALKRDTTSVKNLKARGIDLSENLATFKNGIADLTAVRDDAILKIKAGTIDNAETAFSDLQDNFFDQMEDVWANDKTINVMGNLAQFPTQSKQEMNKYQSTINKLEKQKIDTTDLKNVFIAIKAKVAEIQVLSKVKPPDVEAVLFGLEELNGLRGEYNDVLMTITGDDGTLPWEDTSKQPQGNIQFNFNPGITTQSAITTPAQPTN